MPRPALVRPSVRPYVGTLALTLVAGAASRATAQASHDRGMDGMAGMGGSSPATSTARARPAPAPAYRAELERQLAVVRANTARYRDLDSAKADGFVRFVGDEVPLMGEHWYRKGVPEPPPGTPVDRRVDLAHPTTLQYATIDGRHVLVGVAYSARLAPGEPLPEGFAGPEDHWHQHDVLKFFAAATEDRPFLRWIGNRWLDHALRDRGDDRSLLTMVHAWVWLDNPDGVFAMDHRALPYLRAGLPAGWTDRALGGDRDAALGVSLLPKDGCRQAVKGPLWIAHASKAQAQAVGDACRDAAARVARAVTASADPRAVNAEAGAAWRAFDAARRAALTPHQLERIAAVTEHAMAAESHDMAGMHP